MIQEINVATVQDLTEEEDDMCFKKSFHPHSFSHPRSTPPYSQAASSPRHCGRILCKMGPRVPDAKSSLHLLGSSSVASYIFEEVLSHLLGLVVTTVRSLCLKISLSSCPESPRTGGCSAPVFPPRFGCLSSQSLPSCWERRRRTTCTWDVV